MTSSWKIFKILSTMTLTILLICNQFDKLDAKPQSQYPWDKSDDNPFGIGKTSSGSGTSSNSNPFDDPFFKNREYTNTNTRFSSTNDGSTFNRDVIETSNRDHERIRKNAMTMFWIITASVIVTFILCILGVVACICIPTCYLARYRNRRTEGRVYQPAPIGNVPLTGYPSMVIPPPAYQGQPQIPPGHYPSASPNFPHSNNPTNPNPHPYPPAGPTSTNPPMSAEHQTAYNPYYGSGENQTKAPYPDLPYPKN